ncbi:hypothetical protein SAMN05421771_4067 [Granulicella pectinivorans]|uniref:Uncharacterized protein n=1 Tax=Granulicella pectinivorans TaxID=474950 RepID=A0A1I6MZQ7_9BACT|nr:hypothetical protein [Granulicella pectinivorans]SFS21164.1 hypothetical protein SAMN05421771_4067 [Granulicella pectinivorans]
MTSRKKQVPPSKGLGDIVAASSKWILLWLLGYVLGIISPRSWIITKLTSAPNVQAISSISQNKNCTVYQAQFGTQSEALDEVNIEIELPSTIVDHRVVVGGDDVGGVLRITGISLLDDTTCLFEGIGSEVDQIPTITSGIHGLTHSLFVLHAAPLVKSTPITMIFTMKNGAPPRRLFGTYTYQRFEVPIKHDLNFILKPLLQLNPVGPGKHTITITAHS